MCDRTVKEEGGREGEGKKKERERWERKIRKAPGERPPPSH